jgi:lipid-A-disaccharide synthase
MADVVDQLRQEPPKKELRFFLSAGEESGELHGSELIEELKLKCGNIPVSFSGLGGTSMQNNGVKLLYHTNELSTIGFIDVLKKLRFFKNVLNHSLDWVKEFNPDCVILIDYPGFNLKFAQKLRDFYTGKIIYYISPQLWAWHERRVFTIKKFTDKILVVFPFEVDFYKKYDVQAEYVGHPLVKKIKKFLEENEKEKRVFGDEKTLFILPGSRKDEINNHLPTLLKTAAQLNKEFDINIKISKSKGVEDKEFNKYEKNFKNFNFTNESSYRLILNADLVLTKAGTSTMECALIGTPFALFYKTFPINYYLLKPIVKVDKLGMINILSNENIVKEFVQSDFNVENLLFESRKILTDNDYREKMISKLLKIWDILGNMNASENAAKIILNSVI